MDNTLVAQRVANNDTKWNVVKHVDKVDLDIDKVETLVEKENLHPTTANTCNGSLEEGELNEVG